MSSSFDYQWLLGTPTQKQWEHIGTVRRSGVVTPLFSIFSKDSIGIGEIPDLRLLVDWCRKTGISIIQLLPLNDVGFDFTPYDSQSMFALDPMYLRLTDLQEADASRYQTQLKKLRKEFPSLDRVDYRIKGEKLALLWTIFKSRSWKNCDAFRTYQSETHFWLKPYALFKVIKNHQEQRAWQEWPAEFRDKQEATMLAFSQEHGEELEFQEWLQWQLKEQFQRTKAYAQEKGVFLMGDLPFLVSRDSADVWANQNYFKMDLSAGAPPDMFFAKGQRWGMPPYNWPAIASRSYDYLREKLRYAENFYDLYRIDHFVGMFRIWTISLSEPPENGGLNGRFDPPEESVWEQHGQALLNVMIHSTHMLPCAEDLGTVPDCSYKIIKEYGVVGTDVQRWVRDWKHTYDYKPPEEFRPNGLAAISTHDLSNMKAWWEHEIGTLDELLFRRKCESHGFDADWMLEQLFDRAASRDGRLRWRREIDTADVMLSILYRPPEQVGDFINMFRETRDEKKKFLAYLGLSGTDHEFTPEFAQRILETVNRSASIFSLQLLIDWLWAGRTLEKVDAWDFRINCPGVVCAGNWNLVMPFSLEELLEDPANPVIFSINEKTQRTHG